MRGDNMFSVIMPVHYSEGSRGEGVNRISTTMRAIRSIYNQQYPFWELIIVDDGSQATLKEELEKMAEFSDPRVRYIWQEGGNRAVARNRGMDGAKGDWICWLDSDDEYSSHYLREANCIIEENPEYNVFNFASIIHYPDHKTILRRAFKPPIKGKGHSWFRAGGIATGSFIFKRKIWASDPKYRIPDASSPYQLAAESKFNMKLNPNEDAYHNVVEPEGAFADGRLRVGFSLGNPWGDDFLQFYKLTRDNVSKAFDTALYIQYPRNSEEKYGQFI